MNNIKKQGKEKIVQSEYWPNNEDVDPTPEEIENFFRSREKDYVSYLVALGFPIRGREKKIMTDGRGHEKIIVIFCFNRDARSLFFPFQNNSDSKAHNVNAKLLLQSQRNVTSMIVNF